MAPIKDIYQPTSWVGKLVNKHIIVSNGPTETLSSFSLVQTNIAEQIILVTVSTTHNKFSRKTF